MMRASENNQFSAASVRQTPANQAKTVQSQTAFNELLDSALVRGFFGTVSLELSVQDGTIQHLRRRLERFEK